MDRVLHTRTIDRLAEASVGAVYESLSTSEQRNIGKSIQASSALDTQVLVNSGKLPVVQIDSGSEQLATKAKSSSEQESCDTTYTHADWEADKLALSKALENAKEALANKDIQAFKEFFGDPNLSPEVRQEFIKRGGEGKIERAFGEDSTRDRRSEEHQDALEFAYFGKLSVTTQIAREYGFWGLNKSGVEDALKSMSPEEQAKYHLGEKLEREMFQLSSNRDRYRNERQRSLSDEERDALDYHKNVYDWLTNASGYSAWSQKNTPDMDQVASWESLIKHQPASEIKPLDICEVQKTSIKVSQQAKFEEQERTAQIELREREIELEQRKALEASRQELLKRIPDMVRDAAADGYRGVTVLNLGRADECGYRDADCNQDHEPYFNPKFPPLGEPIAENFAKPQLDDWQQKVYDHILAQGLKPSFELRDQWRKDEYDRLQKSGIVDWTLVARW